MTDHTHKKLSLALAVLGVACAIAQAVPTIAARDLKPGMKGYGMTVFFGQQVERFEARSSTSSIMSGRAAT
jgi:hypothetical protein